MNPFEITVIGGLVIIWLTVILSAKISDDPTAPKPLVFDDPLGDYEKSQLRYENSQLRRENVRLRDHCHESYCHHHYRAVDSSEIEKIAKDLGLNTKLPKDEPKEFQVEGTLKVKS